MTRFKLLVLALCLLPTVAYAETAVMSDFSKGLNSQISPWNVPQNQATLTQNIRFNDVYGGFSKRGVMFKYGDIGAYPVKSMHRYYKSNGIKQLLVTGLTFVKRGLDSSGEFTVIDTGVSDGKRWSWVTYKDNAIGMNGYDNTKKYDGHLITTADTDAARTAGYLMADLGAPFAELNTGSNLTGGKYYQYFVAFTDGTSYTYSAARSNPLLTGGTVKNIYLKDIPLGPAGTTKRYIYRTLGKDTVAAVKADTTFYLVSTLSDNTTIVLADTMTDAIADNAATPVQASVSTVAVTPPKGKYGIVHDERLFIAGNNTDKSDVYWSEIFLPDYFKAVSFTQIRPDDGDTVTFLKEQLGTLVISKENSLQKFYTQGPTSIWYVSDPYTRVGCPAPYSAAETPFGIIYLSRKGLYVFNGSNTKLISDAVTPETDDVLDTAYDEAVGTYWENEYQLAYTSDLSGDSKNNRVLIYDKVRDAYAIDHKNINCYTTFGSGTDYGVLYSGSSATGGTVYAHQGAGNELIKRYKSEFDAGVFDDMRSRGTELDPVLELGWDITIDEASGTIDGHSYGSDAIIDRMDDNGTWTSETYEINASKFDKLYWNENLGGIGDVQFKFRVGVSATACATASYGSWYGDPSGSDISDVTANNFVQFFISASTTSVESTPTLYLSDGYVFKVVYSQQGSTPESDFLSKHETGWLDFNKLNKWIKKIKVFYIADTGTLTVNYKNDEGDFDESFNIDMVQTPPFKDENDNTYYGLENEKVFTYFTRDNSAGDVPIGRFWKFGVTETGGGEWTVTRIEVTYDQVADND